MKNNKLIHNIKVIVLFNLLVSIAVPLNASNYITVATIGNRPPAMDKSMGMQKMVDNVINFWGKELAKVLPDKPDLIVLTEVCTRPGGGLDYDEQNDYYSVRKDQVLNFFASVARENNCYISFGSKSELMDGVRRNSCIILDRRGEVAGIYHKNFPTIRDMKAGTLRGTDASLIECDFGKVACAICFDLNFDELLHKYMIARPEIILFPSLYHGGLVQANWAYSCRSFFVGVIGGRTNPSEIRNPLGQVVATTSNYTDFAITTINLDYKLVHLDYNSAKIRALKEKYGKDVTITDPGQIGVIMITSEHEDISSEEMVKEFDIELVDDYFNRSREYNNDN